MYTNYQEQWQPQFQPRYYVGNQRVSQDQYYKPRQAKKSGSKTGQDKNGNPYITGWKVDKRTGGLIKFLIVPTSSTKQYTSKSGKQYEGWMAVVTFTQTGERVTRAAFVNLAEMKARIPSMNIVVNPRAANGGYCGKSGRPKQNRY